MVKDFKYIIRKIIIGVGICIAMYFFRNYLVVGVNAKAYYSLIPTQNSYAFRWSNSNGVTQPTEVTNVAYETVDAYQIPFYLNMPNRNTSSMYINNLKMYFLNNSMKANTSYNMQFIIYLPNGSSTKPYGVGLYPYSVFLRNNDGATFTCEVYNNFTSGYGATATGPGMNATFGEVFCNDVYLPSQTNFYVDVVARGGEFGLYLPVSSYIGMSKLTAIENNDNASTTQAVQETNNFLKDDEEASTDDFIDDLKSNESSDSPVSDLIVMPITLLQAYLNGFDATCGSYDLGTLYGHQITLPCIQPQRYLGASLWSTIDILISLFLTYNVGLMCISIYESITSLDDNFQNLYTPRHAKGDYQPKHAKE